MDLCGQDESKDDTLLLQCRGAVIEGGSVGRLKTAGGRQANRVPLAENVRS